MMQLTDWRASIFRKGQMADAMRALQRIEGRVPEAIRDDIEFLRANIHLADGRPAAAVEVLTELQDSQGFGAYAAYNLGIAYLQDGQRQAALEQLDRAGQISSDDPAVLAIRDKSNLVLGTILLEDGEYDRAIPYLNRVRLDGPYSNQALLSAGWANLSTDKVDRAVVPWKILAAREVTDRATQEAMLALPYAYGKLNVHGRAAISYGHALDSFGAEIDKLNESIESIREGKFLEALIREEIRKDKDWVDPAALPARDTRDLLPDGTAGIARFPDGAAELSRPGGSAQEAAYLAVELRFIR